MVVCIGHQHIISKLCIRVLHSPIDERNRHLPLLNYFFYIYHILNFIHIYIYYILDVILLDIEVSLFLFLILIHIHIYIHILYQNTGWSLIPSSGVGSLLSHDWVTTSRNTCQIIIIITGYWFQIQLLAPVFYIRVIGTELLF
jgi:hypothetical protein